MQRWILEFARGGSERMRRMCLLFAGDDRKRGLRQKDRRLQLQAIGDWDSLRPMSCGALGPERRTGRVQALRLRSGRRNRYSLWRRQWAMQVQTSLFRYIVYLFFSFCTMDRKQCALPPAPVTKQWLTCEPQYSKSMYKGRGVCLCPLKKFYLKQYYLRILLFL